ncbi:DUF58 domain-containing protein [Humibacter sp. RRB41]|uniref:DUF58 domain-containing protein n=1 Tax=Humibacter sp. RRB41 TaxID=2919946 RepID=UPI001FAA8A76|nr:DUF58 domain-containing protein [Humibacter sp. RRB41]
MRATRVWSAAQRPRPTWRGAGIALAGALAMVGAAVLGRVDLLVLGIVLVLLPLAAAIAVTIDRPWISVSRTFESDLVVVGETANVALLVRNEANRKSPGLRWRDACPAPLEASGFSALPQLGEHARASRDRSDSVVVRYSIKAAARGVYDVGPLLLERTDPFGLVRCLYAIGASKPLIVVPRARDLGQAEFELSRSEGYEHELVKHSIPNADELIAREYRPGDPLRRVHWRATARHDKLMVRQEEPRSNPETWVLFDTDQGPHPEHHILHADARNPRFEAAVDLLASIGTHLVAQGFVLGVVETAPIQMLGRAGTGRAGIGGLPVAAYDPPGGGQTLLAGLAGVSQTSKGNADPAGVLSAALRRNPQAVPAFVVVVDGDRDELAAVSALRILCDPAVVFFVGDRPDLREHFERRGWTCVDVAPDDSPEAVWQRAGIRSRTARHG